ncbi:unnamed protein product [Ilex paraguariensis]|uniref:Uncharacterized protein n=1 Tax=Ilex paraguariensis TaxID=185542 RepID=A0ABC8SZN3_9AQUA
MTNGMEVDDDQNLHAVEDMVADDVPNLTGFDAIEEEEVMGVVEKGIWIGNEPQSLLDVNDSSIFYNDFPLLPDFPCMSSSSSSSSNPAPTKPIASSSSSSSASSSSAASWAVLKSEAEDDHDNHHHNYGCDQMDAPPAALSSTDSMEALPPNDDGIGDIDCLDVMANFGYMDLIDSNDFFDPSSIFQNENPLEFQQEEKKPQIDQSQQDPSQQCPQENDEQYMLPDKKEVEEEKSVDELGRVFFDWLKSNRQYISAEDMRNIKLKRSTIESASKRLGGSKEGKKQLLKLILEWVEQYQLQKKRMREASSQFPYQCRETFQNPNPNPSPGANLNCTSVTPDPNSCFSPSQWMAPPPPYVSDPTTGMAASQAYSPMLGYVGDPYSNGATVPSMSQTINGHPYPPSTEYQMLDSAQSWTPSQLAMASQYNPFPDNNTNLSPNTPHPLALAGYGNQYPYQVYNATGERFVSLGSSATKEARKKRMARQRRFSSHHHRHHHNHNHQNHPQNQTNEQHAGLGGDNCTNTSQPNSGNWAYWSSAAYTAVSAVPVMLPGDAHAPQPPPMDRPPMQASNHQRPSLSEKRQGWKPEKNLKFLLQKVLKQSDVGDFVRANGLQEGDFIVLYSDTKCGKYLIRGVKVRQPGPKSEGKKPARRNLRNSFSTGNGSSSSPIKPPVN